MSVSVFEILAFFVLFTVMHADGCTATTRDLCTTSPDCVWNEISSGSCTVPRAENCVVSNCATGCISTSASVETCVDQLDCSTKGSADCTGECTWHTATCEDKNAAVCAAKSNAASCTGACSWSGSGAGCVDRESWNTKCENTLNVNDWTCPIDGCVIFDECIPLAVCEDRSINETGTDCDVSSEMWCKVSDDGTKCVGAITADADDYCEEWYTVEELNECTVEGTCVMEGNQCVAFDICTKYSTLSECELGDNYGIGVCKIENNGCVDDKNEVDVDCSSLSVAPNSACLADTSCTIEGSKCVFSNCASQYRSCSSFHTMGINWNFCMWDSEKKECVSTVEGDEDGWQCAAQWECRWVGGYPCKLSSDNSTCVYDKFQNCAQYSVSTPVTQCDASRLRMGTDCYSDGQTCKGTPVCVTVNGKCDANSDRGCANSTDCRGVTCDTNAQNNGCKTDPDVAAKCEYKETGTCSVTTPADCTTGCNPDLCNTVEEAYCSATTPKTCTLPSCDTGAGCVHTPAKEATCVPDPEITCVAKGNGDLSCNDVSVTAGCITTPPSGTCAPTQVGCDPACTAQQVCLNGACFDVECNPACAPQQTCLNGVCSDVKCDPACAGEQTCLNGACVDTSSASALRSPLQSVLLLMVVVLFVMSL